jgi:hypothetical protein
MLTFLSNQKLHPPAPANRRGSAGSALALLVAQIGANHTHHAVPADDLAIAANLLHGSADFHDLSL